MPGGGSEAIILPALMGSAEAAALPAFLGAAVDAAAIGGLGSMLMGQDPLQGALLGGLTGGVLKGIAPQGLGSLFGGGINPSAEVISPALAAADPSLVASGAASMASEPSFLSKIAAPAALGLGALALDKFTAPEQVGPPLKERPESRPVSPLEREQQPVDPQSYLTPLGNRNFYKPYSMQPQYMAKGGHMRYLAEGGSSSASSSNIPPMGLSRYVKGRGDGQSDEIDAKLSNGEFVISAPVVSAIGRGSNDAGAKKLNKMQKDVMRRTYKGSKAPRAIGLGSYQ